MPAKSENQQQLAGMALAYKRGELSEGEASESVKNMAKNMTEEQLRDYAKTKHKGLPEKKGGLDERTKFAFATFRPVLREHEKQSAAGADLESAAGSAALTVQGASQEYRRALSKQVQDLAQQSAAAAPTMSQSQDPTGMAGTGTAGGVGGAGAGFALGPQGAGGSGGGVKGMGGSSQAGASPSQ